MRAVQKRKEIKTEFELDDGNAGEEGEDVDETNAYNWQDVHVIAQLVGTIRLCSWYSEKDGCIYIWGGQSGEGKEWREEMKVLDLVGTCLFISCRCSSERLLTVFCCFLSLSYHRWRVCALDVSRRRQPES